MPAVVVISAHTLRGSEITIKALECGAFDFITKPQTGSPEAARDQLMHALKPILKSLAIRRDVRSILQNPVSRGPVGHPGEESPEGGVQTTKTGGIIRRGFLWNRLPGHTEPRRGKRTGRPAAAPCHGQASNPCRACIRQGAGPAGRGRTYAIV